MKLTFEKDAILNGLNIVSKAIPSKTTMSILECILIDASANEIKFTANDMEMGIETKVEGQILEKEKLLWTRSCFMKSSASSLLKMRTSPLNQTAGL